MKAETQVHDDIRVGLEAYAKLPLQERLARLREIGILTADLQLSERYGGEPAKPLSTGRSRVASGRRSK